MATDDLHGLVDNFVEMFGAGTTDEQQFAAELYRLLADGRPVAAETLAAAVDRPARDVRDELKKLPSFYIGYDESDRVIEWGGFGLDGGNNDFTIRGNRMWAWCAWDALFVPAIVGDPALVESDDPETGARVRMTVGPDGVQDVQPAGAMMTMAIPGMQAFPDFRTFSFQKTVFFFESRESAARWLEKNPGPVLMSLEEGFALGQTMNRLRFPDVAEIAATLDAV